ncbi:MAG: VWA domain-containing protein [Phycisphaerae bacterium]|nr:VWA domain-containing protein [Phycisphaerae bacterium]
MNAILQWLLNLSPEELSGGRWSLTFASGYGNYVRLGLALLAMGLVWLVVRNYRREGQASPAVKRTLATLRIVVLLLLIVTLFQPAVLLRVTDTLHSSLLVLLDDSLSMSFQDRYASTPPADRAKLAAAVGVEESQIETLSRGELLQRLLRNNDVWRKLNRDHPIELLRFSTDKPAEDSYTALVGTIPVGALEQTNSSATTQPAKPNAAMNDLLAKLTASGYQTDPSAALRDALERFQGRRIGGVVLISDGQPTPDDAAERLRATLDLADRRGATRYTVLVGDPTPPKNLTVTALRAPREVRAKGKVELTALLQHRNLAGKQVEARLYRRNLGEDWPDDLANTTPLTKKTITLPPPESQQDSADALPVKLETIPPAGKLGEFVYRALVAPLPDERTAEDNHADAFIRVSDQKIRVLLISGDAGWEFRYLRNYFLRQPELYRLSVWQQNADPDVNQSASTGMKLTSLPKTLRELIGDVDRDAPFHPTTQPATRPATQPAGEKGEADVPKIPPGYDVVILYDPSPTKDGFDKTFIANLWEFVTRHRGGLCYIASSRNTDEILRDPAAKKLADLLPVVVTRNEVDVTRLIQETRPQAWPIRLTGYGLDHPVTTLETPAEDNQKVWSVLPGIFRHQAISRRKPAARVLAEHSDPTRKMRMQDEAIPLIAVHTVGGGRVVYLGADETWRWRFLSDGLYHRRFWGNVVRYLAPLHARQVMITTGGDRFSAGTKITVEVEAYDREYRPLQADEFVLRMIDRKTNKATTHKLPAVEGKPGRFHADILPAHTGTYELTCDPKFADPTQVAGKQIVVHLPRAEQRRSEADAHTMRTIASKDEFALPAGEIGKLAEWIPPGRLQTVREKRFTLWDTKGMWILLVLLLTAEWLIRKRVNMT